MVGNKEILIAIGFNYALEYTIGRVQVNRMA
jgi:hypothetical protein